MTRSLDRRQFIRRNALGLTALALTGPARAQQTRSGKRFLFIHAQGGWDPLAVFAPLYGVAGIDMEPDSDRMRIGGFELVDSPLRPAVRQFFERHGDQTLVLDGMSVRSVNHETCQAVSLTGSTSDRRPDWATLLATGARERFDLPHIVFSGPVFTGPHAVLVSRAQGALAPLLDGRLLENTQPGVRGMTGPAGRLVDRFLARRAESLLSAYPDDPKLRDLAEASHRARRLSDNSSEIQLQAGGNTQARICTAIEALRTGVCRCASVGDDGGWDTHLDNSLQSPLFQNLFTRLDETLGLLASTTGPDGRPLAEDTLVVVTSEMARTPAYNGTQGRDHWPYTSMMVIGPGITGGRAVGGYTDGFLGIGVDPTTGEADPDRAGISTEDLGATLLALGDVDPAELLPLATPLTGLMT